MSLIRQPMLAPNKYPPLDQFIKQIEYPVYASPKLDGIRAICDNGKLLSRKMKLIPNAHTQKTFASPILHGLDSELIVGEPTADDVYRVTDSGVMTRAEEPDVRLFVFDIIDSTGVHAFKHRYAAAKKTVEAAQKSNIPVVLHKQVIVHGPNALLDLEEEWLEAGYEGVMLRAPHGPYKQGRSTLRQGWLLKLKRFVDGEARIIGFQELKHNLNEQERDERGYAKRSSHKANKVGGGTLGSFLMIFDSGPFKGVEFRAGHGPGMDMEFRQWAWQNRDSLLGRLATVSWMQTGVKDLPRHPKFKGLRNDL